MKLLEAIGSVQKADEENNCRKAFFKYDLEVRFLIVLTKLSENNEKYKQIIVLNQIKQLYNRKIFKNIEKCVDK